MQVLLCSAESPKYLIKAVLGRKTTRPSHESGDLAKQRERR
jgi:hypothetical protein